MKRSSKEVEKNNDNSLQCLIEDGAATPFSTNKGELYCTISTSGINKNYLLSSDSFRVAFKSTYKKYTGKIITDNQFQYMLNIRKETRS